MPRRTPPAHELQPRGSAHDMQPRGCAHELQPRGNPHELPATLPSEGWFLFYGFEPDGTPKLLTYTPTVGATGHLTYKPEP